MPPACPAGGLAAPVSATATVAPGTTTYGIPGSGTIAQLSHLLGDGWHVFRTGHSPVPVTDGVLLLCMVLTAIVAAAADALAFRSEATLAAVVPSLLLFVFASTLGTTELRTATTIGYSLVALVFLMLQHQALLEQQNARVSALERARTKDLSAPARPPGGSRVAKGKTPGRRPRPPLTASAKGRKRSRARKPK